MPKGQKPELDKYCLHLQVIIEAESEEAAMAWGNMTARGLSDILKSEAGVIDMCSLDQPQPSPAQPRMGRILPFRRSSYGKA